MRVRLVIFDLDRTLWDHPDVSSLAMPISRLDDETVEDAGGVRVHLHAGAREVLTALRERRLLISIASWNDPEPVFAILEALSLRDFFTLPKVEPHPYKERIITALVQELAERGTVLQAEEILYVDDRGLHLRRVGAALPGIRTFQANPEGMMLRGILDVIDAVEAPPKSPGCCRWA